MLRIVSLLVAATVGCSSSDPQPAGRPDTGRVVPDVGNDPATTGLECMNDGECGFADAGAAVAAPQCSSSLPVGSLYPTPVCFGLACDVGDGATIKYCDKNTGVCLPTEDGGLCLPSCSFKDDGAAPVGCVGGNACNVYGWGAREDGTIVGVGYCLGGCSADADCKHTGDRCQVEDALCRKSLVSYSRKLGEACAVTVGSPSCNCLAGRSGSGYCTTVCRYGRSTCEPGFSCDPALPAKKLLADDVVFTKAPVGIVGYCLKNCSTDADCAGLSSHCAESAGMAGQRTCQVGKRRCATDAHCEGGQKCSGATADAVGTCG